VGPGEAAAGGDDDRRRQRRIGGVGGEQLVVVGDGVDPVVGADVGVQAGGVGAEVADDLVAARVVLGIAGEGQSGQAAVAGRGEEGEAVVVARPRPYRLGAGLEDHRAQAAGTQGVGGGEAGLAAADDDRVVLGHEVLPDEGLLAIASAAAAVLTAARTRKAWA
jgi:hypothetical protein